MALHSLYCANVLLRNCSLTHFSGPTSFWPRLATTFPEWT